MNGESSYECQCNNTSKMWFNKVFAVIDGKFLLWHVVNRLRYVKMIDDIIIATTFNPKDDAIEDWCCKEHIKCFRGRERDVLNRYYNASNAFPSDAIVRVTADDPFKEPSVINKVIKKLVDEKLDFVTNNFPPSFPEGLDCEAFTFNVLEIMEKSTHDSFEREHVTQYVYHNPDKFRIGNVVSEHNLSSYRWTIDNEEDYEMVKQIYEKREEGNKGILLMKEIFDILEENPGIIQINSQVKRSTMYQ